MFKLNDMKVYAQYINKMLLTTKDEWLNKKH